MKPENKQRRGSKRDLKPAKGGKKNIAAAREAATEKQRLEVERQRQYFESLSPQEKEKFLAAQRARQEAAARLLLMMFSGASSGGNSSSASPADDPYKRERDQQRYQPAPQPAPAPVQPISPFYGNGPSY